MLERNRSIYIFIFILILLKLQSSLNFLYLRNCTFKKYFFVIFLNQSSIKEKFQIFINNLTNNYYIVTKKKKIIQIIISFIWKENKGPDTEHSVAVNLSQTSDEFIVPRHTSVRRGDWNRIKEGERKWGWKLKEQQR